MSIERLNKAVTAAGYAMATPDDDAVIESTPDREVPAPSRAVVLVDPTPQRSVPVDAVNGLSGWLKGYLPGFGGRQPA